VGFGENSTISGIKPNPADPRTTIALNQLGLTVTGRQAALKMLHPCMENTNAVIKVPDGSVPVSVSMERRDEYNISKQIASNELWDCIVLTLPFLVVRQVVVVWPSSSVGITADDLRGELGRAIEHSDNPGFFYPSFQPGIESNVFVSILGSTTLTPTIASQDAQAISDLVRSVRRSCLGTTTDLNASDLTNQGRVVMGQWSPDVARAVVASADTTPVELNIYRFQLPAVSEAEIVSSDAFSVQHEAKLGSYMPIRPIASELGFTPAQEWRRVAAVSAGHPGTDLIDIKANDLFLSGWCIGVEHWSGLDPLATLRIKVREDLEVVASANSVYSPFATPALPDDSRARSMVQEFCRKQPHAYPADYNDLGQMLGNIVGGIGDAIHGLGIPILSDIAGGVSSLAKGPVGNLLGGLVGGLL